MKNCRYENKNGTCGLKGSHAYRHKCYTTDSCKCWEPPTNADRIRAMTDEELADSRVGELVGIAPCSLWIAIDVPGKLVLSRKMAMEMELDWLRQPAKEEA